MQEGEFLSVPDSARRAAVLILNHDAGSWDIPDLPSVPRNTR